MIRRSRNLIGAACLLSALVFSVAACAGGQQAQQAPAGQAGAAAQGSQGTAAPTPATLTAAELAKLRWIEGAWRGTGDVEKPFYERYRFENDSTLAVEGFPDETLSKADDVTRFELKDGRFGNGGEGSRWAASEVTDDSITFVPVKGARNSFRWQKEPDGTWTAILEWPAAGDKPARRRVYKMERWPKSK
jgi:hypothetical protein